ncbi:SGNH/GDSL hydrolase family protein [Antribacter gilvus]|uniref:SGNH/GDSL hydrolase family protein n=1 Tax=Antribacter gilvus TaxID=2304675 RepID=UPI000F79E159|nr:SGNH/GDSL hydrolase family protein [Antribacter gilvus]
MTTPDPDSAATVSTRPTAPSAPWTRYVAIGDSFSEGLWDPHPDLPDTQRGWADRLAEALSARRVADGEAPLQYANLAIRGRLLRPILAEQLPVALDAQPDLVSVVGGGNDILRPAADIDLLSSHLEDAVVKIRATGADVLLATGFKGGGALSWTNGRVGIYNANLWTIARRHGAHVVDLWGMHALHDLRSWSEDRIHLTPDGHHRVAQAALTALGLEPDDTAWDEPLGTAQRLTLAAQARANTAWARTHVAPWIRRRLTGRSSGDGRTPKWPTLDAWPRA